MLENIENRINSSSLRQELSDGIKRYPSNLKEYFKGLGPAFIVSSVGSAAGQWAADRLGFNSTAAQTTAAYIGGYIPGYTYFFTQEYLRNKSKYPKGFFSREMGHFALTFLAADYVADLSTFTPAFISSNVWMKNNTEINPAIRSLIAWNGSGLLYIAAISAIHPLTKRITQSINNGVKYLGSKIKPKKLSK